jgi:hypothetical protein
MCCGLLGFLSGELGPAVISRIGSKLEITMKTLILAAIRCSLMFTVVAAVSLAYPASVQAVPTTYRYIGNPFTDADPPYTTSMFVTAMVTLAGPLGANMPLTEVTPTAFTLFDGVQTISRTAPHSLGFRFATNARGEINFWLVEVDLFSSSIATFHGGTFDSRNGDLGHTLEGLGSNRDMPGVWSQGIATPDAGSTLSLMTLTLMALGLVARRFQRAAG